jgi:hypothetical protein
MSFPMKSKLAMAKLGNREDFRDRPQQLPVLKMFFDIVFSRNG